MDEFKKYLQQNRGQMDADIPSAELFNRIEKQSVNRKGKVYTMVLRVVAVACFAAGIFFGMQFLLRKDHNEGQETVSSITQPVDTNKPAIINVTGTTQQIVKVESPEKITQPKITETRKQIPVAYQLLNSFELNYNKLVSLQLKSIRTTPVYGESPDYFNGFKISMHQIEQDEVSIKIQIKKIGLNDELLEQLINVYQQKINLLKNLQHEIGSMNNKIKENQQPADSIKSYYINI